MRLHRQSRNDGRRGGALILATMAVTVVAVLTTCILQVVGQSSRREQSALDTRKSFYLAEAGLAEAYNGIRVGKTGNVGTAAAPAVLGDGLFWVEATELDEDRLELESTAMCGIGLVSLSMVVEKGEQSVASLGVFSSLALDVPPGSTIQGYDSAAGPLAPSVVGRIGSNENIVARGTRTAPTTLRADLAPGPSHTASVGSFVTHTGGIEPRPAAVNLPPGELPFDPSAPGVSHSAPIPLVLPSGDVGLSFLTVAADSQVIAQGPCNLVVNDLTLEPGASLEFDTGLGPVKVWVRRSLTMNAGSQVACSSTDPSEVLVQLFSSTAALLTPTGSFYGVVYAPTAEVTVGAQVDMRGAVIARRLVLQPGAHLSFDQHLDTEAAESQMPKLVSWRILEMQASAGPEGVRDPFDRLGLDPATLLSPADAHQDQVLDVVYMDSAGAVETYAGMESDFDWTAVQEVESLARDGEPVALPPPEPLPPVPPPPSAVMNLISDLSLTSRQLRDRLVAASPLTTTELMAAIGCIRLGSGDLKRVLEENSPLGSAILFAAIDRQPQMSSGDLKHVLEATTPLPPEVLARVITGPTPLSSGDRNHVLDRNGIEH